MWVFYKYGNNSILKTIRYQYCFNSYQWVLNFKIIHVYLKMHLLTLLITQLKYPEMIKLFLQQVFQVSV